MRSWGRPPQGGHTQAAQTLRRARAQADICQLGLDQRKVNMLAREYCAATKRKFKPVVLSHGMLPGLLQVWHATVIASSGVSSCPLIKGCSSVVLPCFSLAAHGRGWDGQLRFVLPSW